MSKPVLKSNRDDVRALDDVFEAFTRCSRYETIRVLRFYCDSQSLKWSDLFPEAKSTA